MPAASSEAHVQRELDELAAAIGRSVSVDDARGQLIGYSAQADGVDPVRVRAILTRKVPGDVLEHQRRHGVETAGGPVVVPANEAIGMAARLCIPLLRGRRRLGYLWILDEDEALRPPEVATARATAQRLVRLLEARATAVRGVDALFGRLLRARRPDAGALARLRELAGLEPGGRVRVAVVLPERAGVEWADVPRLGLAAHAEPERVTVLIRAAAAFDAPLPGSVAGVSPPAPLERLAHQHAMAVLTAGCAAVDPRLPRTVDWTGLGVYGRLLATTRPDTWDDAALLEPDMLEQTLETYLDHAGDPSRTATELSIHRTTLYYRLGRLRTEHGIDLQDGLTRTDLHVALKLRRLAAARRRFGWSDALIALAAG